MIRLVQLQNGPQRRVAVVEEPHLRLLDSEVPSVLSLVRMALEGGAGVEELVGAAARNAIEYEPIYQGRSEWTILPPVDHPEPARCLVSGTGLTHLGSARNRDAMHDGEKQEAGSKKQEAVTQTENRKSEIANPLTDSMKMFRWGVEGGKPAAGQVGVAPEWFYKGTGFVLRAHNEPLEVPSFAEDGGEEAEIAGVYVIDSNGRPVRIGMAQGNEFSDHVFEKKNYLNLAGSKLRTCSLGPELVIDPDFARVPGEVSILRDGKPIWSKPIATGEAEMSHSLANLEHHHFKFDGHRRPGDVHIHFFGACALSFGDGLQLRHGDVMQIGFTGFGRPLRNPLHVAERVAAPLTVRRLS